MSNNQQLSPNFPLITKLLTAYLAHIKVADAEPDDIMSIVYDDYGDEAGFAETEAYLATLSTEQFERLSTLGAGKEYEAFSKAIPSEHHKARSGLADMFETADDFE